MNYTKTLRNYCMQNQGKLFDVAFMMDRYFYMIPYKTYLKILNRLREEGILTTVSKGVYLIGDGNPESAIRDFFVGDMDGMVIGAQMYHELGITKDAPESIQILSRNLVTEHKNIGRFSITAANIFFADSIREIICVLELIRDKSVLTPDERIVAAQIMNKMLFSYTDYYFQEIVRAIHYDYSTIVTLHRLLDCADIPNRCLEIYQEEAK